MANKEITMEIMEYMVWVVEVTAAHFFCNDKAAAYDALNSSGLWNIYVEHYDTTHTLGMEYLLSEIKEYFDSNGVAVK